MDGWRRAASAALVGLGLGIIIPGCGALTPRNFRAMAHPAPVVRAGAVGLGDGQPDAVAIPAWIARLDDKDPVVRMAANESLKGRTGQDFGFVAWDEPAPRAEAVAKWQGWWKARSGARTLVPRLGQGQGQGQGGVATRRRKR